MKKIYLTRLILGILVFSLLGAGVYAATRGTYTIELKTNSSGVASGLCYGYYKIFNARNYSESNQNVWVVARHRRTTTADDIYDWDTDVSLPRGSILQDTNTSYLDQEEYWSLLLQPWNGDSGCHATGSIRKCP